MPVVKDAERYDRLHAQLLREILMAIKDELEGSDLDHDHVYELTGKIGFAVSAVIDGSVAMTKEGERVLPFLAFSSSEAQRDNLIVNEQGSYLHELVYSLFDGIFDEHHDEDEDEGDEDEDEDEDEYEDEEELEEEEEYEDEESEEDDEEDDGDDDAPRRH